MKKTELKKLIREEYQRMNESSYTSDVYKLWVNIVGDLSDGIYRSHDSVRTSIFELDTLNSSKSKAVGKFMIQVKAMLEKKNVPHYVDDKKGFIYIFHF